MLRPDRAPALRTVSHLRFARVVEKFSMATGVPRTDGRAHTRQLIVGHGFALRARTSLVRVHERWAYIRGDVRRDDHDFQQ